MKKIIWFMTMVILLLCNPLEVSATSEVETITDDRLIADRGYKIINNEIWFPETTCSEYEKDTIKAWAADGKIYIHADITDNPSLENFSSGLVGSLIRVFDEDFQRITEQMSAYYDGVMECEVNASDFSDGEYSIGLYIINHWSEFVRFYVEDGKIYFGSSWSGVSISAYNQYESFEEALSKRTPEDVLMEYDNSQLSLDYGAYEGGEAYKQALEIVQNETSEIMRARRIYEWLIGYRSNYDCENIDFYYYATALFSSIDIPCQFCRFDDNGKGCYLGYSLYISIDQKWIPIDPYAASIQRFMPSLERLLSSHNYGDYMICEYEPPFSYEIKEDGTARITKCTVTGDVVIPDTIDGYVVTELGEGIFYGKSGITTIRVPATITMIDKWDYVFSYCDDLTAINVDSANPAFCAVDGVLFDKNMEMLYNFPCSKNIESYVVPDTVESICCTAFADAKYVKDIYLSNANCTWSLLTFCMVSDLSVYYRLGGESSRYVAIHKEKGLVYENDQSFPTYIEWICDDSVHADRNNLALYGAYDATCTWEGSTGWWYCPTCGIIIEQAEVIEKKEHVYGEWKVWESASCIEEGVKWRTCEICYGSEKETIDKLDHKYSEIWTEDKKATCLNEGSKSRHCMTEGCISQTDIMTIPVSNEHTYGEWSVIEFPTCDQQGEKVRTCTTCTHQESEVIPATGFVEGESFFQGMNLYTIKTVKGKTGTVVYEFSLENSKKVVIPKTVKINGMIFKVTEISEEAFKDDTQITSVTIPEGVTKIGKEAFSGCKNLKKITIKSTKLKSVGKNAIKGINKKATIKVPKKHYAKYKKLFKSKTGYKKTMRIKK